MTILAKDQIRSLIFQDPQLIEGSDIDKCLQSASYDLRLGKEYYKKGKILKLTDDDPWLELPAYELIIVTTHEKVNMPTNLVARFGLRLNFVKRGILFHNEPQIDPGYHGRLACLLFNLSNSPIRIMYRERFATIEFEKLDAPAPPYPGGHQDFDSLNQFFGNMQTLPISALAEIYEKNNAITKRVEAFIPLVIGTLSAVVAALGVLVAIIGIPTLTKLSTGG